MVGANSPSGIGFPPVSKEPTGGSECAASTGWKPNRHVQTIALVVCLCHRVSVALAADSLELRALLPAGGQRGTTVEVRAIGEFPRWPVMTWASSNQLKIEADEEQNGLLRVAISDDARPGVHWLRLYDALGASRARPFVVETCHEVAETNGDDKVQHVDLKHPAVVNGCLSKNDEVDQYRVRLERGQTLVAALTAHRFLGSPMDAVMQLVDADHAAVVMQNDDAPGRDPRLVFTAKRDGTYIIRLFAFPEIPTQRIGFAGGENFVYRLALSVSGLVDRAYPLAVSHVQSECLTTAGWCLNVADPVRIPDAGSELMTLFHHGLPGWGQAKLFARDCSYEQTDVSPQDPMQGRLPMVVTGRIAQSRDQDAFRFSAGKDDQIRIAVESRTLGFPLDPVLTVLDAEDKELARQDDNGGGRDCSLDFKTPADGTYRVVVNDLHDRGGEDYLYFLSIERVVPSFSLEVAGELFDAHVGSDLEIPITVVRRDGFEGDIHVTALGLPPSVLVGSSTSKHADDTSKAVKVSLRATAATTRPFRVIGVVGSRTRHVQALTQSSVSTVRTGELWLTVAE